MQSAAAHVNFRGGVLKAKLKCFGCEVFRTCSQFVTCHLAAACSTTDGRFAQTPVTL